jgi:hypothetical protein
MSLLASISTALVLCLLFALVAVPGAVILWVFKKRLQRARPAEVTRNSVLKTIGFSFCIFMISLAFAGGARTWLYSYVLPTTVTYPIRLGLYQQGKMNVAQGAIFEYCESTEEGHAYDLLRVGALAPTSAVFGVLEKSYSDCVTQWPDRFLLVFLYGPASFYILLKVKVIHRQTQIATDVTARNVPGSETSEGRVRAPDIRVRAWAARLLVISGLTVAAAVVVGAGFVPKFLPEITKRNAEQYRTQHAINPISPVPSPNPSVATTATTTAPTAATISAPSGSSGTQTTVAGAWDIANAMKLVYGSYDPVNRMAFWSDPNPPADKHFDFHSDQGGTVQFVLDAPFEDGTAQKHFVVTATSPADEDFGCHACSPLLGAFVFAHSETGWVIESQERFLLQAGGWGKPPSAELVRLADGHYGVKFTDTFTGQGETSISTSVAEPVGNKILVH